MFTKDSRGLSLWLRCMCIHSFVRSFIHSFMSACDHVRWPTCVRMLLRPPVDRRSPPGAQGVLSCAGAGGWSPPPDPWSSPLTGRSAMRRCHSALRANNGRNSRLFVWLRTGLSESPEPPRDARQPLTAPPSGSEPNGVNLDPAGTAHLLSFPTASFSLPEEEEEELQQG